MSSNFRVLVHRNRDSFHLRLFGNFDGSSAWQLIRMMDQKCIGSRKIFIHTSGLSSFHPFGREVFQKKARGFKKKYNDLVFTGDYGDKLTLPESTLYSE